MTMLGVIAGASLGVAGGGGAGDYDPYWDHVVFLCHGEGADGSTTLYDRSMYAPPMSTAGACQVDTDIPVADSPSVKFGADADYAVRPWGGELNLALSAPDFCMEAWVYCTDVTQTNQIFGRRRNSNNYIMGLYGGNLLFAMFSGTSQRIKLNVPHGITNNTVAHVCVIRIGNTYYGFVNGVLVGSNTNTDSIGADTTALYLGNSESDQSSRYWRGNLNWMRITVGHQRYDETGFTPDTVPYLTGRNPSLPAAPAATFSNVKALLGFDGADEATTFTDESSLAQTISFFGNAKLDDGDKKFGTTSLLLDGSGDYVTIPNNTGLNIGGNDFCLEAWIKPDAIGSAQVVSSKNDGSARDEHLLLVESDGRLLLQMFNAGSTIMSLSSYATLIAAGVWTHVAATRSGNWVRLFINGELVGKAYLWAGNPSTNAGYIAIGRDGTSGSWYFAGRIDEYRFVQGEAVYTESFVPRATAFPRS